MEIKLGDYVAVKDGITIETGELTQNWAGQVNEVVEDGNFYKVIFDAPTMRSISDKYILDCIGNGAEPFEYVFAKDDFTGIIERRDNALSFQEAHLQLSKRYEDMWNEQEEAEGYLSEETASALQDEWIQGFLKDPLYEKVRKYDEEQNVEYVCVNFMDFAFSYITSEVGVWSSSDVIEICLDLVPRKTGGEVGNLYDIYGEVLAVFFEYLGQQNLIDNAEKLIATALEIKDEIPIKAKDPSNWGMAKSFMAQMTGQGIDPTDQNAVNGFIRNYNSSLNIPVTPSKKNNFLIGTSKENKFKHIGRNDKITVRYDNGKVVEDIKFKKVKKDLENGICAIIEK